MKNEERRQDARVEKHFMVHYRPAEKPGESWRMSPLKDVSRSGARFLCEEKCAIGSRLELELHMPTDPKPQKIHATVMRIHKTESRWDEVGVRFSSMDTTTQQAIDAIVKRFLQKKHQA